MIVNPRESAYFQTLHARTDITLPKIIVTTEAITAITIIDNNSIFKD